MGSQEIEILRSIIKSPVRDLDSIVTSEDDLSPVRRMGDDYYYDDLTIDWKLYLTTEESGRNPSEITTTFTSTTFTTTTSSSSGPDGILIDEEKEKTQVEPMSDCRDSDVTMLSQDSERESETKPYPEFSVGPFEGVEKKLMIEFYPDALKSSPLLVNGSLRSLSPTQWQSALNQAACQILCYRALETPCGSCTCYLLSESSLFVYNSRVILKTCGTTTPLLALPTIISFVAPGISCSSAVSEAIDRMPLSKSLTRQYDMVSFASLSTQASDSASLSPSLTSSELSSGAEEEGFSTRWSVSSAVPSTIGPMSSCHSDCPMGCAQNGLLQSEMDGSPDLPPGQQQLQHWRSVESEHHMLHSASQVIASCLFTHLTYCFPCKQRYPHRSNDEEREYLDRVFLIPADSAGLSKRTSTRDVFTLPTSEHREFFVYAYHNPGGMWMQQVLLPSEFYESNSNDSTGISETGAGLMRSSELMMLGINECCVEDFAGRGDGFNPILASREKTESCTYRKIPVVQHIINPVASTARAPLSIQQDVLPLQPSCAIEEASTTATFSESNDEHNQSRGSSSVLDQFWFKPCGYSCNALIEDARGMQQDSKKLLTVAPHFMTAHISPELESSYASLEATFPFRLLPPSHLEIESGSHAEQARATTATTADTPLGSGLGQSEFLLCPVTALTTFNPLTVHVIDLSLLWGQSEGHQDCTLGTGMLGGVDRLYSRTDAYQLVGTKEYQGTWYHVRHAEYLKIENEDWECEEANVQ